MRARIPSGCCARRDPQRRTRGQSAPRAAEGPTASTSKTKAPAGWMPDRGPTKWRSQFAAPIPELAFKKRQAKAFAATKVQPEAPAELSTSWPPIRTPGTRPERNYRAVTLRWPT